MLVMEVVAQTEPLPVFRANDGYMTSHLDGRLKQRGSRVDEAFWEEKTGREWPFGPLRFLGLFSAERFLGQGVAADISLSKIGLLSGLLGSLAEDWGVF